MYSVNNTCILSSSSIGYSKQPLITVAGGGAVATPIFPQRQIVDMPQQPVNATGGTGPGVGAGLPQVTISSNAVGQPTVSQQVTIATAAQLSSALPVGASATFQRIQGSNMSGQASVSVFRGDGSVSVQPASVGTQQPPAAHSGNVALTTAANVGRSSTQPAPPAHITQTPVTQPAGNIKPEPIGMWQ